MRKLTRTALYIIGLFLVTMTGSAWARECPVNIPLPASSQISICDSFHYDVLNKDAMKVFKIRWMHYRPSTTDPTTYAWLPIKKGTIDVTADGRFVIDQPGRYMLQYWGKTSQGLACRGTNRKIRVVGTCSSKTTTFAPTTTPTPTITPSPTPTPTPTPGQAADGSDLPGSVAIYNNGGLTLKLATSGGFVKGYVGQVKLADLTEIGFNAWDPALNGGGGGYNGKVYSVTCSGGTTCQTVNWTGIPAGTYLDGWVKTATGTFWLDDGGNGWMTRTGITQVGPV